MGIPTSYDDSCTRTVYSILMAAITASSRVVYTHGYQRNICSRRGMRNSIVKSLVDTSGSHSTLTFEVSVVVWIDMNFVLCRVLEVWKHTRQIHNVKKWKYLQHIMMGSTNSTSSLPHIIYLACLVLPPQAAVQHNSYSSRIHTHGNTQRWRVE